VEREARLNQLLDLARLAQKTAAILVRDEVRCAGRTSQVSRFAMLGSFWPTGFWLAAAAPGHLAAPGGSHAAQLPRLVAQDGTTDVLTGDFRRRDRAKIIS